MLARDRGLTGSIASAGTIKEKGSRSMMDETILTIRKHLKKKLDARRFEHTLGVEFTCAALAMRYGCDLRQAELAGLLHDCAKRYDGPTLLRKCREREIPVTQAEEQDPALLHAKLGAWMAGEKYGIEDEEIKSAIRCHNTGKPGMSLLDKILYVADYIEPGRDRAKHLPELRKQAFLDLDEACLSVMEQTLEYLRESGILIDPMTEMACEDMRRVVMEKRREATTPKPEENSEESMSQAEKRTEETNQNLELNQKPGKCEKNSKEERAFESVKRNGKTRRRSFGGEKRRRHQNYRH